MEYIVIQPSGNGHKRTKGVGYKRSTVRHSKAPNKHGNGFLFNVVEHPDGLQAALECDNAQEMPLQNAAPLALLVDELSDTIGIEEAAQWAESMIGTDCNLCRLVAREHNAKDMGADERRRVVCSGRRNDRIKSKAWPYIKAI